MKSEIETAVFLLSAGWVFYKFCKTKNPMHLFLIMFCMVYGLRKWPIFLPAQVSVGLLSLLLGSFCLYENYRAKTTSPMAFKTIMLFVGFGLMFFTEGVWKMLSAR